MTGLQCTTATCWHGGVTPTRNNHYAYLTELNCLDPPFPLGLHAFIPAPIHVRTFTFSSRKGCGRSRVEAIRVVFPRSVLRRNLTTQWDSRYREVNEVGPLLVSRERIILAPSNLLQAVLYQVSRLY
ncbi:hypothetical protein EPR50_G00106670 [Perca flavescens]|uniref:Uncharacterized protein n=1 Tax=Perca flavescens TaxID=8167 RepID=A0A484CX05_PERFV|nr:hypothetical protein EPR50_G00106670 [Perca flavescens]